MNSSLLVARVLLAVVFIVAGRAKLSDVAGSRKAMTEFGVPRVFAAPFGAPWRAVAHRHPSRSGQPASQLREGIRLTTGRSPATGELHDQFRYRPAL